MNVVPRRTPWMIQRLLAPFARPLPQCACIMDFYIYRWSSRDVKNETLFFWGSEKEAPGGLIIEYLKVHRAKRHHCTKIFWQREEKVWYVHPWGSTHTEIHPNTEPFHNRPFNFHTAPWKQKWDFPNHSRCILLGRKSLGLIFKIRALKACPKGEKDFSACQNVNIKWQTIRNNGSSYNLLDKRLLSMQMPWIARASKMNVK